MLIEEERSRALVERISDPATVVAPDGTIQYASHSYRRAPGYAPEEMVGKHAADVVVPEERASVLAE